MVKRPVRWTINDVVLHLYASDYIGIVSVQSSEAFVELRRSMMEQREGRLSMIEESRHRFPGVSGKRLLDAWIRQIDR